MKSATKGAWRSIRCLLLIACAGGVLAADNTWVGTMNLSFASPRNWFASPQDSSETPAVFDYSTDIRRQTQMSMGRLLNDILFSRNSAGSILSTPVSRPAFGTASRYDAALIDQSGRADFLEMRSESASWARGPVSGGGGANPSAISATAGSWIGNNPSTQDWSNTANWAGGIVADGSGAVATITFDITGPRNVNLDTSRTIGSLVIGDANGSDSYTLTASGGSQLIFDNGSQNTSITQIATSAGDTISAPILLMNSIDISNASSNLLTISGPISSGVGFPTMPSAVSAPHSIESEMGDILISGSISDGVGQITINKGGTGTLTLSGTNSYSGSTQVFGGTLLIDGDNSAASGNVFVSGNGTLGGSDGIIGADVYVSDGGTITGGTPTGVGTLTMNNLSFIAEVSGGTYLANLSGGTSDLLAIIGQLDLGGSDDAISIVGTPDGTTTYVLATFESIDGTFNTATAVPGYDLVYDTNQLLLVPIPEPGTWIGAALALGAIGVMGVRRRNQTSHGRKRP